MDTSATAPDGVDAVLLRKLMWRVIPFLMVLYFVAFLDRVNISFASLQMNADLGISSIAYGIGASVFFVGYFFFEVPSNLILAKVGARLWIARIMITWGIISLGMAFVTGERSFYVLRFLLGASEAGFFPGIMVYISRWFPARYRGRVTGIFMVAIPLSGLIGSPISGVILEGMNGVGGMRGWQWMFIIEALPAIVLGLACLRLLADSPAQVNWLTAGEKRVLERMAEQEEKAITGHNHYRLADAFTNPGILLMAGTLFCIVFGTTGIAFFLPQIIKSFGYSDSVVGWLSAIPYLFGAAAMVLWGRRSDIKRERAVHLMGSLAFAALGFVALAFTLDIHMLALLALIVAAMGVYASNVVLWSLPTSLLTGATAAAAVAFINSLANLSGVVAPTLLGWSRQVTGGFAQIGFIFAGFMCLGVVLMLFFRLTPLFRSNSVVQQHGATQQHGDEDVQAVGRGSTY
ncbi:MFS transporter [Achromobacter aloeverae]|uniref:MFS transporter n=1 Tax=Achromobacter aloeverae TaxID=1750518 RepID=A0A4Q1HUA2_9BURK|nr:MFS transporter [Achromobacter aloeverae]RXN93315.1 MFS transporter [Achromobacter aloeverae]